MTILIVEDDASLRQMLVELFKDEGYEVLQAENAEKGLTLAFKEQPGLVLTDCQLPDFDGMELTKRIKAKYPFMAVVAMSAAMMPAMKLEYERLRVNETWSKGSAFEGLLKLVSLAYQKSLVYE